MTKDVHVEDFNCFNPVVFYERCMACAKKGKCHDRALIINIIKNRKRLRYEKRI